MDDIAALFAEFEQVQTAEIVQKLSERNCIEIILKLISTDRIHVVFSSTGKELITPGRLKSEISNLVRSHGGRISITDVPEFLNVDLSNVEKSCHELIASSSLFLVNGYLLSKQYLDGICTEVAESVLETGMMTVAAISQHFNLPVTLLSSELDSRLASLGTRFSTTFHIRNQKLYTDSYIGTHNSKVEGLLLACTRPVSIQTLITNNNLQEKITSQLLETLVKDSSLPGTLLGSGLGLYTPHLWLNAQKHKLSQLFLQNNFIEFSQLTAFGVSKPSVYISELFPEAILLQRIAVHPVIFVLTDDAIKDAISSESWADIRTVLPSLLSSADISSIAEQAITKRNSSTKDQTKRCHYVAKFFAVSSTFLRSCASAIDPFIVAEATAAAAIIYSRGKQSVSLADDVAGFKGVKKSKKGKTFADVEDHDSGKKKRSGRNRAEADNILSRPVLETTLVIKAMSGLFPDLESMLVAGIVEIVAPSLRSQYDKIRDSPHIVDSDETSVDTERVRKKTLKLWGQRIQELMEHFQVFSTTNRELENNGIDVASLDVYLNQTIGAEIVDQLLLQHALLNNFSVAEDCKPPINQSDREQMLNSVPLGVASQFKQLSAQTNAPDFFSQTKSLAKECNIQIKEIQRKRAKQLAFTMRIQLLQQLTTETRSEAVLLTAVILALYRPVGLIVHAPYNSLEILLKALMDMATPLEVMDALQGLKADIETASEHLPEKTEQVKTLILTESRSKESQKRDNDI
uniref:E3 UFM1-protein ligase 1 homolog n=1 Tax=Spongospora subterranea TaxID=70186 RepID=A0A0H5R0M3_9EUKA|eukprot:CRZ01303.1 hypothetical protein [Spongospora subterranea]